MVPMRAGRPIEGRVDIAALASTNLEAIAPEDNSTSATYVARSMIGTALRVRIGRSFDIGPMVVGGLDGDDDYGGEVPPSPSGKLLGVGTSMQLAPRFDDERFAFAGVLDITFYSIPVREEWWCLDCGGSPSLDRTSEGHETEAVFGLSLLPSYRPEGRFTFFGGLSLRNQPQVRGSETVETTRVGEGDSDDPVKMGELQFVASLGAEVDLGLGAHAMLVASHPFGQRRLDTSPAVSAAFAWSVGDPAPRDNTP
jgi:hypothetical protein